MTSELLFTGLSWLGTVLFTAALVPQFVRTRRLGHAADFSIAFLVTVIAASLSMGTWAVSIGNFVVVGGFAANVIVWGYVLQVRLRPRAPAPT